MNVESGVIGRAGLDGVEGEGLWVRATRMHCICARKFKRASLTKIVLKNQ